MLWIELELISAFHNGRNAPGGSTKLIKKLCVWDSGSNHLSLELASQKAQILADLAEAFTVYADGGVYSTATTYELTLQLAQGV